MVEAEVQRRNKLKDLLKQEMQALSQQHDQVSSRLRPAGGDPR